MDFLEIVSKILAIIVSVIGIFGVINKYLIPKSYKLLSEYNKYTDRRSQLKDLIKHIGDNIHIINVYGKKGVGKSYFLKYFADYENKKIPKKTVKKLNKDFGIKRNNIRVIYYEINEYSSEKEILEYFISNFSNYESKNAIKAFKKIVNRHFINKKIVIIFDNITNECVENAIENIIKKVLPISNKLYFILGSIEKLSLPKLGAIKRQILIEEFTNQEIIEYSKNCNKELSGSEIENIINASNGLPIMVDLLISNDNYFNYELCNKYIDSLFSKIIESDFYLSEMAIYIALLSLINPSIPVNLLNDITTNCIVENNILIKLHGYSLIKYNQAENTIKMHDIIRDYLINEFSKNKYYQIIESVCTYYEKAGDFYKCSVFALLLNKNDFIKYEQSICKCVLNSIDKENYTYLISLGNHYFKNFLITTKNNLYNTLSYGYIQALLSIGDYPSAKLFSERENLTIVEALCNDQFKLAIQIADLYHLQSEYLTAIELFNIIVQKIDVLNNKKYINECFIKIAHSYRHLGYYCESIKYYNSAIDKAIEINDILSIIKCNLELSVIYISNPQLFHDSEKRYSNIEDLFINTKKLLNTQKNPVLELLYYRNYARYLLSNNENSSYNQNNKIKNLLDKAFNGYKNLNQRLIYTMYFEYGEYFRFSNMIEESIENYKNAVIFSKKNGDKNLETMSYLGIILSEIKSGTYIYSKNKEKQIELLLKIIDISETYSISINKNIALLLLSFIKNDTFENIDILKQIGLEKTIDTIKGNNYNIENIQLFMC